MVDLLPLFGRRAQFFADPTKGFNTFEAVLELGFRLDRQLLRISETAPLLASERPSRGRARTHQTLSMIVAGAMAPPVHSEMRP